MTANHAQGNGGPFRLRDGSNTKLVLPPRYIEEIKNIPTFSSQSYNVKDFFANYPGFDVFRTSNPGTEEIWIRAMKKEMPAAVPLATAPMAKETSKIVSKTFEPSDDWKEFNVYKAGITIISRITQLVLLGENFMNNEEWQRVATTHSVDVFKAAAALHQWPAYLRPIVHWFLPECRRIRAQVKEARAILAPEVQRRVRDREMHLRSLNGSNGDAGAGSTNKDKSDEQQPRPRRQRVLDAIDWFVAANPDDEPFDYVSTQISLAMAANQTSSNVFAYLMGDLVSHPEYVQPLRDEVVAALRATGGVLGRAMFPRLVLMDSFMKESMRRHPPATITMRRHALADVRLADGTEIPRNTYMFVAPVPMTDPKVWPGAEGFDGRRFLRMREEAQKNAGAEKDGGKYHFVSTSADYTGWDYGLRACPGRFLAANYLMLIFSYTLLHYDFKLAPGQKEYNMGTPQGFMHRPDKEQTLMYRSRKCEVDLA